jgi:hypothetical protein
MLPPIEWKVPSHGMPSTAWPSIWPSRSFISRAALLVKVTERISRPRAALARMWAMRVVSTRVLPVPAPASTSTGAVQRLDRLALLGIEAGEILRRRGGARARGDAAPDCSVYRAPDDSDMHCLTALRFPFVATANVQKSRRLPRVMWTRHVAVRSDCVQAAAPAIVGLTKSAAAMTAAATCLSNFMPTPLDSGRDLSFTYRMRLRRRNSNRFFIDATRPLT